MSTYSKYIDKFNQKKGKIDDSEKKISADKDTYISFLETQLEKVSNAIITSKTYDEKLDTIFNKIDQYDEKFSTLMKLIKMLQNFTDTQELENTQMKDRIHNFTNDISKRLSKLEISTNIDDLETKIVYFS